MGLKYNIHDKIQTYQYVHFIVLNYITRTCLAY